MMKNNNKRRQYKRRNKKIKFGKRRFIICFFAIVAILALVRILFPSVAGNKEAGGKEQDKVATTGADTDSLGANKRAQVAIARDKAVVFFDEDGTKAKHKIKGVWSYKDCASDSNATHLVGAKQYGVVPVENTADAEKRKKELVYIGSNPFYTVRKLQSSIPYLVPRAAALLQDISRNFMDSLEIKGVPLQKLVITSVLRSKEDVVKLGKHNKNVSPNSCHVYGTTFDISYTHFVPLQERVNDDRLKRVLSEVLRDLREQKRCYVKYELHQACYHVTVR